MNLFPLTISRKFACALYCLLFVVSCLVVVVGCSGESSESEDPNAAKAKEVEKKKKPDFEASQIRPLISQQIADADSGQVLPTAKPGHWTTTVQQMRANYEDLTGTTKTSVVDRKQKDLLPIAHTRYALISSRPAVLAKNRPKRIEGEVFIPADAPGFSVKSQLQRGEGGSELLERLEPWTKMPSYQYFFLVLAKEPDRYAFLKVTDTVRSPWQDYNLGENYALHYRVVAADADQRAPLPSNALTWTSVAYVLWDDVNLERITPAQESALVDWLHWGGRLIVNGPDSLDTLRSSFLADYLPVEAGDSRKIAAADLEPLSGYWGARSEGKDLPPVALTRSWSGIRLNLRDGARYVPNCGDLLAERSVGLGSLVVSAMQLDERDLINWPGFDGFLNGALLDRPGRKYQLEPQMSVDLQSTWAERPERRLDAYYTTGQRWFARDFGTKAGVIEQIVDETDPANFQFNSGVVKKPEADREGGVGGWNDFSPVSNAAREALHEAAGVRVPAASFVVVCLAAYLFILVPLNWMVFHAVGRVEWAWIAAPAIAVIGAVAIVHQANLDIGFVRAQTEINFLELHNKYARGHLSRYTALYASLSTTYDLEFDDLTALSAPLPSDAKYKLPYGDTRKVLSFEKYDKTRLRGLQITSSSTQFVHSEQLTQFEGAITLDDATTSSKQVSNRLGIDLSDAVVLHRRFDGGTGRERIDACWLGRFRTGETRSLYWKPLTILKDKLPFSKDRAAEAETDYRQRLDIDELLKLAFQFPANDDPHHGKREEYRLVARYDEPLPGESVTPTPSQATSSTVVLAHLGFGPQLAKKPDVNSPGDVLSGETPSVPLP